MFACNNLVGQYYNKLMYVEKHNKDILNEHLAFCKLVKCALKIYFSLVQGNHALFECCFYTVTHSDGSYGFSFFNVHRMSRMFI